MRKRPADGVLYVPGESPVLFITVCTRPRASVLANDVAHKALRHAWQRADHWLVGDYVIMPDHIHLFAVVSIDTDIKVWTRFWKRECTITLNKPPWRWQNDCWHTRIRSQKHFAEKWDYVQENPVRHGLVKSRSDWPFKGKVFEW